MVYLNNMNSQERKERPVALGFLTYFPDAIMETSYHSFLANDKHNPNTPVHWDKSKSQDNLDSLVRHIIDYQKGERYDDDGLKILTAISWRAMAFVQIELEKEKKEVFNPEDWEEVNGFCIKKGLQN